MVHIIGEILRYIEPVVADYERGCQGGGSDNKPLSEAGGLVLIVAMFYNHW